MRAEQLEALADLLASDGWRVFEQLVRDTFSTERLRSDIKSVAAQHTDMAQIGALSLSKIQEHATADMILMLPRDIVSRYEVRQEAQR
jgi:hypothetical protein